MYSNNRLVSVGAELEVGVGPGLGERTAISYRKPRLIQKFNRRNVLAWAMQHYKLDLNRLQGDLLMDGLDSNLTKTGNHRLPYIDGETSVVPKSKSSKAGRSRASSFDGRTRLAPCSAVCVALKRTYNALGHAMSYLLMLHGMQSQNRIHPGCRTDTGSE